MYRLVCYYAPPGAAPHESKRMTMEPCKTVGECVRLANFLMDIPEMTGCHVEEKVGGRWVVLEEEEAA